ncbi:hypothetical protein ABKN59_010470 [Abortiporus biennis]
MMNAMKKALRKLVFIHRILFRRYSLHPHPENHSMHLHPFIHCVVPCTILPISTGDDSTFRMIQTMPPTVYKMRKKPGSPLINPTSEASIASIQLEFSHLPIPIPRIKAVTMGRITFVNNTFATIHIRVSIGTGKGSDGFFDIAAGKSDSWGRDDWQVAWVLRDDHGQTETLIVQPGFTYQIVRRACLSILLSLTSFLRRNTWRAWVKRGGEIGFGGESASTLQYL